MPRAVEIAKQTNLIGKEIGVSTTDEVRYQKPTEGKHQSYKDKKQFMPTNPSGKQKRTDLGVECSCCGSSYGDCRCPTSGITCRYGQAKRHFARMCMNLKNHLR